MVDKQEITLLVQEYIKGTGLFLVAIRVSNNKITVIADNNEGITIEECAAMHRYLADNLGLVKGDYELQVSSPGLDMPFRVTEQYIKNEGREVMVIDNMGSRFTGRIKNVTAGGFELEIRVKAKGKKPEINEISFNYDQIKSARVVITVD
jgi:ribosome maturation factor RimP